METSVAPPPTGERLIASAFALLLLAFGIGLFLGGTHIVDQQQFTSTWKSRSTLSLGPIGWTKSQSIGTSNLHGNDAICVGVGVCGFGTMVALWAVIIITGALTPRVNWHVGVRRRLNLSVCTLLLLSQLVGVLGMFPPWRILSEATTAGFWLVVSIFASWTTLYASGRVAGDSFRFAVFATVLSFASAPWIGDQSFMGMIPALFCVFVSTCHVLAWRAAWRGWAEWLPRSPAPATPSGVTEDGGVPGRAVPSRRS